MEADGEAAPNRSSPPFLVPRRSYPEIILDAIDALADENASNEWAISGYIKGRHGASLPPKHFTLVPSHLARMICTGEVLLDKNNYRRRPNDAPVATAVAAAAASATPVVKRGRRRRRKRKDSVAGLTIGPSAAVAEDANGAPNEAPVVAADAGAVPVKRGRRRRRERKDPGTVIHGAFVTPGEAFVVGAVKGRCGQAKAPVAVATSSTMPCAADAKAANASLGSSPPLPPYPEMILKAIEALDNENGSDSAVIAGYIEGKYGGCSLPWRHAKLVTAHLSVMKATGEVLSVPPPTD